MEGSVTRRRRAQAVAPEGSGSGALRCRVPEPSTVLGPMLPRATQVTSAGEFTRRQGPRDMSY